MQTEKQYTDPQAEAEAEMELLDALMTCEEIEWQSHHMGFEAIRLTRKSEFSDAVTESIFDDLELIKKFDQFVLAEIKSGSEFGNFIKENVLNWCEGKMIALDDDPVNLID
jgi:hypothetical protein